MKLLAYQKKRQPFKAKKELIITFNKTTFQLTTNRNPKVGDRVVFDDKQKPGDGLITLSTGFVITIKNGSITEIFDPSENKRKAFIKDLNQTINKRNGM